MEKNRENAARSIQVSSWSYFRSSCSTFRSSWSHLRSSSYNFRSSWSHFRSDWSPFRSSWSPWEVVWKIFFFYSWIWRKDWQLPCRILEEQRKFSEVRVGWFWVSKKRAMRTYVLPIYAFNCFVSFISNSIFFSSGSEQERVELSQQVKRNISKICSIGAVCNFFLVAQSSVGRI